MENDQNISQAVSSTKYKIDKTVGLWLVYGTWDTHKMEKPLSLTYNVEYAR